MKTADELIDKIKIDEGNFHHITVTHKINGTLREEIRKAMSLFAMQEVIEALKLHGIDDPSTQKKNEFVIPDVSVQLPTVKDVRSKANDYADRIVCEEHAKRFRKHAKDDFIEGAEWMRTKAVGN